MKKTILIFTVLLFIINCWSQAVSKTINIDAPGTLNTRLTANEKATITDLTVTGNIDARDFKTMRDNMPLLANLDMSKITIEAYAGLEGTVSSVNTVYLASEIPCFAFCNSSPYKGKTSLISVILPLSTVSIRDRVFCYCENLASVIMPNSVTTIGEYAFFQCYSLSGVNLSSSLTSIGRSAFSQCNSLDSIYLPNSLTSIGEAVFFSCSNLATVSMPTFLTSIGTNAFAHCLNLSSITIPESVVSIGASAFSNCTGLTSLTIPSSVLTIGTTAFLNCSGLTSIYMNSKPLLISEYVFSGVNTNSCVLNVPYNAKTLYASASNWSNFVNIVEPSSGFLVDVNTIYMDNMTESKRLGITANVSWTASSNQSWLTLSPGHDSENNTLLLTVEANQTTISRNAIVTISSNGLASQTILVKQDGLPKVIMVSPGGLSSILTSTELSEIKNLKITGSVDARDFKTMRENMSLLSRLDLSDATIMPYTGTGGTASTSNVAYPANEIPAYAFYNNVTYIFNSSLVNVILPLSATSIGKYAFRYCSGLTRIIIPNSVISIGELAFYDCSGLKSIFVNSKPIVISSVFPGVVLSTCVLNVPYGTKSLYKSMRYWSDFVNIVESASGFLLDVNNLDFTYETGSSTVNIAANVSWSASSDQSWITVSPNSGNVNNALTLTAQTNHINKPRTALVTVSSTGLPSQTITIKQDEAPTIINVAPGEVMSALKAADRIAVKDLVITGSIDARDFKAMRDSLSFLIKLDLSGVSIATYKGTNGTFSSNDLTYPTNEIPINAFWNSNKSNFQSTLISIELPSNLTSIGGKAFFNCTSLTTITIPPLVSVIGWNALSSCKKLAEIKLASGNENFSILDGVLFNKNQTQLIQYPIPKTDTVYSIPSSVSSIAGGAFSYCVGLTSISIPASVNSIGRFAFSGCINLTSIYIHRTTPVDLSSNISVFYNINKTNCTLYVPSGSKVLYQAAVQWKDFTKIVELATALPVLSATSSIQVYPNPVIDNLHISGIDAETRITILDLNGRIVLDAKLNNSNTISLGVLPRGQYILRAIGSKKVENVKIMKM